jgi:pyruvate/2-oxoglutarate dehydrogenase complex dihydrolipoamide acyltransferase (E2) component
MTPDTSTRAPYTPTISPTTASANASSTAPTIVPNAPPTQPAPHALTAPLVSHIADQNNVESTVSGSTGVRSAAQRLTRSRALLQTALEPHSSKAKASATSLNAKSTGASATAPTAGLSSIPGLALGAEAIKFWWSRHPLRLVVTLLATTANASIKPVAQRSPVALVAGAFLVGGLLAWARPWRLVVKPILFAGVMPQITSALIKHFSASANKNANSIKH